MNSSRLPGKMMLEAGGMPILGHLIRRLKNVPSLDKIILATTTNDNDQILVDYALEQHINIYRGSEDNVMERVIEAAEENKTDLIVEVTGDCPIIDHNIIEQLIRIFLFNNADYVSNLKVKSYPDGMEAQIYKLDTLKKSSLMTTDNLDLEHVTRHIRNNEKLFSNLNLVAPPDLYWPELGLTLDELEDYKLIENIINFFEMAGNPLFSCDDVIKYLKESPHLLEINKNIKRTVNN